VDEDEVLLSGTLLPLLLQPFFVVTVVIVNP